MVAGSKWASNVKARDGREVGRETSRFRLRSVRELWLSEEAD
jgi:hypothetical protein